MSTDDSLESARQSGANAEPAHASDAGSDARPAGPEALGAVFKQLAEAIEYLAYLVTALVDRTKLKIRHIAVLAALGVIAVAAVAAFVVGTVWLLLSGIAGGVGVLLGDRPWLGSIVTSLTILLVVAPTGWIAYRRWRSSGLKTIRQRYHERQAEQKARFGREVEQTAESGK